MIEAFIITVLVLWSCVVVFKKLLPKTAQKTQHTLSNFCQSKGWVGLAKWLSPKMNTGCGGSCSCGTTDDAAAPVEVKPIKWK